jgi:carbamoyltransferase
MSLPVMVVIDGKKISGFLLSHQFAHAAYAYYSSGFDDAAVFTHDGSEPGTAYWGGMYFYGEGNALYLVAPHYLSIGHLYERIAFLLNLGYDSGPGKLMGLAPWGEPSFFDQAYVGNWFDGAKAPVVDLDANVKAAIPAWISDERHPLLFKWLCHCLSVAKKNGYRLPSCFLSHKSETARCERFLTPMEAPEYRRFPPPTTISTNSFIGLGSYPVYPWW